MKSIKKIIIIQTIIFCKFHHEEAVKFVSAAKIFGKGIQLQISA